MSATPHNIINVNLKSIIDTLNESRRTCHNKTGWNEVLPYLLISPTSEESMHFGGNLAVMLCFALACPPHQRNGWFHSKATRFPASALPNPGNNSVNARLSLACELQACMQQGRSKEQGAACRAGRLQR